MGSDLSKLLSLDPTFHHSPHDVVAKEKMLAFCSPWDLSIVNDAIRALLDTNSTPTSSLNKNDRIDELNQHVKDLEMLRNDYDTEWKQEVERCWKDEELQRTVQEKYDEERKVIKEAAKIEAAKIKAALEVERKKKEALEEEKRRVEEEKRKKILEEKRRKAAVLQEEKRKADALEAEKELKGGSSTCQEIGEGGEKVEAVIKSDDRHEKSEAKEVVPVKEMVLLEVEAKIVVSVENNLQVEESIQSKDAVTIGGEVVQAADPTMSAEEAPDAKPLVQDASSTETATLQPTDVIQSSLTATNELHGAVGPECSIEMDSDLESVEDEVSLEELLIKHSTVCTELTVRISQVTEELKQCGTELEALLDSYSLPSDGLDVPINWRTYLDTVSEIDRRTAFNTIIEARNKLHIATRGYAMERDLLANKELKEYRKRDIIKPVVQNHEKDGHTDDSASESESEVEEDQESDDDDDNGEEDDDGKEDDSDNDSSSSLDSESKEAKKDTSSDAKKNPKSLELKVAENSSNPVSGANPQEADPPTTESKEQGESAPVVSEEKTTIKPLPSVIKRKVPASYDVTLRSPIFFGYTLTREAALQLEVADDEKVKKSREVAIFARKKKEVEDDFDETMSKCTSKLNALNSRRDKMLEKRKVGTEKRAFNYKKSMAGLEEHGEGNEIAAYQAEFERETRDIDQSFLVEDRVFDGTQSSLETQLSKAKQALESQLTKHAGSQDTSRPMGKSRIAFHKNEIPKYKSRIVSAKHDLEEAGKALAQTYNLYKRKSKTDPKARSQILFAEGQITVMETAASAANVLLVDEEFLLERALSSKMYEDIYLPLFNALVTGSSLDNEFTTLELTFAFLCASKNAFRQKVQCVFYLFATSSELAVDDLIRIIRVTIMCMETLGDIHPTTVMDYPELLRIAITAFTSRNLTVKQGMNAYEFTEWCSDTISRCKYLAEIMNEPWHFRNMSRYTRQSMSTLHQYTLGLITMSDVKYKLSREALTFHTQLAPYKMEILHERALAMGQHDPLKTDYSKYLPKRGHNLHSQVFPLVHGCYGSLPHFDAIVATYSATKLQTTWRCNLARARARKKMKMHAFYHSKGQELLKTKNKIVTSWRAKDLLVGLSKGKYEAKVRMRMVKYRTKGHVVEMVQVKSIMMDEEIREALAQTAFRFRDMEYEMGYIASVDEANADIVPLDLPTALRVQLQEAVARPPSIQALLDKMATPEENERNKPNNENSSSSENEENEGSSGDELEDLILEDLQKVESLSMQRKEHLVCGEAPGALYRTGETTSESNLRMELSLPTTNLWAITARLQKLVDSMTSLKTKEFLLELPSKRHICAYTERFRTTCDFPIDLPALTEDITDHFGIMRNAERFAKCLVNIAKTDLEDGLLARLVHGLHVGQEKMLFQHAALEHTNNASLSAQLETKKQKSAAGQAQLADIPNELRAAEADRVRAETIFAKRTLTNATQVKALDALRTWKMAEYAFHAVMRQNTTLLPKPSKTPVDLRLDWHGRWKRSLDRIQKEEKGVSHGHVELSNVVEDFCSIAGDVAETIAREYYLPPHLKSLLPVARGSIDIDGRKDEIRSGKRVVYEVYNIRFKVGLDDHGMYDGFHEAAAKAIGNAIRASRAYLTCSGFHTSTDVQLPLSCMIDTYGLRIQASVILPIDQIIFNDRMEVRNIHKELVYGTNDRGEKVASHSRELLAFMTTTAAELNLSVHQCRGENDLTARTVASAGDIHGYMGTIKKEFYLVHFQRGMPPEDPTVTTHLCPSPRGQTIFWRMLRPEFVKTCDVPLSPDAFSLLIKNTKDAVAQQEGITNATKVLVSETTGFMAHHLYDSMSCTHPASENGTYVDMFEKRVAVNDMNITTEMHFHGLNMRHVCLVRNRLAYWLQGSCTLRFNHRELLTSTDFTAQLSRSMPILIQGKEYVVSTQMKDPFTCHSITLDPAYMGPSVQHIPVLAGDVGRSCVYCARELRTLLLAEMVTRTFKQMLRNMLRYSLQYTQMGLPHRRKQIILAFFNLITGAHPQGRTFWQDHLYVNIKFRFGANALSEIDRREFRTIFRGPWLVKIVTQVAAKVGVTWTRTSLQKFSLEPEGFRFALEDLAMLTATVRHNATCLLSSASGNLLNTIAIAQQARTYRAVVLSHDPIGYWPLDERRGSGMVKCRGRGQLHGLYNGPVQLELQTAIKNDPLRRAVAFLPSGEPFISVKGSFKYTPTDADAHVSVEAWVCVSGGNNTLRVIFSYGRFSLVVLKNNEFAFVTNVHKTDVMASRTLSAALPPSGKASKTSEAPATSTPSSNWHHLVGTCDGTNLKLYMDGNLVSAVDVSTAITLQLRLAEQEITWKREEINVREQEAKMACWRKTEADALKYFKGKEGNEAMKNIARRLQDEFIFNQRIKKNNKEETPEKDAKTKKMGKKEAYLLAKKKYTKDNYEDQLEGIEFMHQEMRDKLEIQLRADKEEQSESDARVLSIGCVASKRKRTGRNFYVGSLAHIAYYDTCLLHDNVIQHYLTGSIDRAKKADRYYQYAAGHFKVAIGVEPENRSLLEAYASSICQSLLYDMDHANEAQLYQAKVAAAIATFHEYRNANALATLLRQMPADAAFASLFSTTYQAILALYPKYFTIRSYMTIMELSEMPAKYSLGRLATDTTTVVQTHADIIKKVLTDNPFHYGDHNVDMRWMCELPTPSVIISLILRIQDGESAKEINFTKCTNVTDGDVQLIAKEMSNAIVFNASKCAVLTDASLLYVAEHCRYMEELYLDDCVSLTDAALIALEKMGIYKIKIWSIARCFTITDVGVEALGCHLRSLTELSLRGCERITDSALATIGDRCPILKVLDVGYCFKITDMGLLALSTCLSPTSFTRVDFSSCTKITNVGIAAFAKRCVSLTRISLLYCYKITNVGILSLTHNCLGLQEVNLLDLHHVSDTPFLFDRHGDGRPVVDANMLSQLRNLNIADCKGISNTGLAEICHRAKNLETLNAAGCLKLNDMGLKFMMNDIYDHSRIGLQLRFLDFSHCKEITDVGIHIIMEACPSLRALHLTGCVAITPTAIQSLVQGCTHIQSLSLGYCRNMTDAVLDTLAHFLWLEELILTRCRKLTDAGMQRMAREFSGLRRLTIAHCSLLTDATLRDLESYCPVLSHLDISAIPHMSSHVAQRLKLRGVDIITGRAIRPSSQVLVANHREATPDNVHRMGASVYPFTPMKEKKENDDDEDSEEENDDDDDLDEDEDLETPEIVERLPPI